MNNTESFPPRGSGVPGRLEMPPSQIWGHPERLGPTWDWQPGKILLGRWKRRLLGRADDRHIVTIAGSRAGKTMRVLIPNVLRYPGSKVVMDTKGEMALATVAACQRMGQQSHVLDPFGVTGIKSASFNPLGDLGYGNSALIPADASQVADAMLVNNSKDPHWTDAGKNLIRGFILHLMSTTSRPATIRMLRRAMCSTIPELDKIFTAMANSSAFDGIVANIGSSFLGKLESSPKELQGILSTVQEQTATFDDVLGITDSSDFKLTDLRRGKMSIYIVLPGMRMGTHYRFLRLVIQMALGAMERAQVPRGELPVWFVLEEFPTLGHMRSIETAAGLMAGYGVKLWAVLQDLTQLQTHYQKSWETFLGNTGIIQAFGNVDATTCDYLSKMLGMTQVIERQEVRVTGGAMAQGDHGFRENLRSTRLLDPNEIAQHFARDTGRQLILTPGRPPIFMELLDINGGTS